ncbi:TetR/AcrR family transcriptional regulator [Actinomadura algeriensis]|uniref:AcrR family transcriptional regulator n=1 Tax=Actinomadura algeriensis TaxID=1679523 RepID=A0ABR9JV36_9ACTN|nr:TetR/AcrR family transcriptional regulator [Actinomadura algeriensis]MBE1534427.1 AcrR family transcriptional regulator [Actinomadura algeriensis]
MPRDASATRERLLHAGARRFAVDGIDAARTREIVAHAGQSNDSAITYHFGSRAGLLEAILRAGVDRMETVRRTDLDPADLPGIVTAIVAPTAAELRTDHGRDFLRITAQLAGRAGIRDHRLPRLLHGTNLARQLELLETACRAALPEPHALERISNVIGFLTTALADRAVRGDQRTLLGHDAFVTDLTAMLTAALQAPVQTSATPRP